MMEIRTIPTVERVLLARGQGAYYFEDIQALQKMSIPARDRWKATSLSDGFHRVREIAESVSIGLVLSDGFVAWGDAVSVSYGGKSGREKLFRFAAGKKEFEERLLPLVKGLGIHGFREIASIVDKNYAHRALRYGLSQALLVASAWAARKTECQLLAEEWGLPLIKAPIPLQGSCGNDRYDNADKMIVNRLEALPHSQVDDLPLQFGARGEVLLAYAAWLRARIPELGDIHYQPSIHLDVHGAIAKVFGFDVSKVSLYLKQLRETVHPFNLRVESAAVLDTFAAQVGWYQQLKTQLRIDQVDVALVMDEWANTKEDIERVVKEKAADWVHIKMPDMGGLHSTIEAMVLCKQNGIGVLLGGSCIETDISSRITMHVAMALRPSMTLVKPGMGVNEGISICRNEMNRIMARMP